MTEVSPSSKKVDDFLSSLSQLSQDRLRQDQQRQRDLQRNIDELRSASTSPVKPGTPINRGSIPGSLNQSGSFSSSEIPSLKFNRSRRDEEEAPPMPERPRSTDDAPPLPRRRDEGPPLPLRRSERAPEGKKNPPPKPAKTIQTGTHSEPALLEDFDVVLINPVGRKESSRDYPTSSGSGYRGSSTTSASSYSDKHSKPTSSEAPQYRSFAQVEQSIKTGTKDIDSRLNVEDTFSVQKQTPSPTKSSWVPPSSSKETKPIGPKPLFPQRVYYNSSSIQKGDTTKPNEKIEKKPPPKPTKPKAETSTHSETDTSRPKSDWLSSSISNKKTTSTNQDQTSRSPPVPKQKADWLSSSLTNSRTTVTQQETSPVSYKGTPKTTDWMSSLSNSKSSLRQSPVNLSPGKASVGNTSPLVGKKPTNWIDSALKKSDSHKYIENPSKPSYQIVKTNSPVKPVEESQPELFSRFEKLKHTSHAPEVQRSKIETPTENPEYLSGLERLKKHGNSSTLPPKPSKPSIGLYTSKEDEILKSTMLKLHASKAAPEKPPKPSVETYTREEEELLKSTMSKLGVGKNPPPKPQKPSIDRYTQEESELLKSTMSRLSPKKKTDEKLYKGNKYEEQDAEILRSQMKKLGSKPVNYHKLEKPDDSVEGLVAFNKLKHKEKPEKPEKPEKKITAPTEPEPKEPPTFQDKLSSILRASTVPELSTHTVTRTNTDPIAKKVSKEPRKDTTEKSKLTHPNKGRSRGPKRKLPKTLNASTGTPAKSAKSPEPIVKESGPEISDYKNKKPPPVNKQSKPKPLPNLKPTRQISGELFI